MTFPNYELEFLYDGRLRDEDHSNNLLRQVPNFSDLLVLCHGGSRELKEARSFYSQLCDHMSTVMGLDLVPRLRGRKFAAIRVFWPSRRFTDVDLLGGTGAVENDQALVNLLAEIKSNPVTLGGNEIDPVRHVLLQLAQTLLPRLEADGAVRREYVFVLRSILNPAFAHADDSSEEFFTRDPEELFSLMGAPVKFEPAGTGGQEHADAPSQSSLATGDLQGGIRAAARRLAAYAAYCEMKERASTIGAVGLGPLLRRIRDRSDSVRLHLIGHGFGARLIAAAATSLPPKTGPVTLSLIQAALSHHALAQRFDGVHDGAFRTLLAERRVSGPIIVTYTGNDSGAGFTYPLSSRIARASAAAGGARDDSYCGMGRSGALHTPEAVNGTLLDIGHAYRLAPGKVYNLNADRFIMKHTEVTGPEIAYAILNGAGAA